MICDVGTACEAGEDNEDFQAPHTAQSRVPFEIWTNIFELVVQDAACSDSSMGGLTQRDEPWIISGVSSEWRSIALRSPSLWTIVILNSYGFQRAGAASGLSGLQRFSAFALRRLQWQLERSHEMPLELTVYDSQCYPAPVADMQLQIDSEIRTIWRKFCCHIHRSRSIAFFDLWSRETDHRLGPMDDIYSVPPDVHFPSLLQLRWSGSSSDTDPSISFKNAPNLRSLDLCLSTLTAHGWDDMLPYAQLTDVILTAVFTDWHKLLSLLTSVQKIFIRRTLNSSKSTQRQPQIVLPMLQSLEIYYSGRDEYILRNVLLSAPNLERLVMDYNTFRDWDFPSVKKFLRRSSCILTSFTIGSHHGFPGGVDMKSILRLMPALTHLDIQLPLSKQDSMNVAIHSLARTRRDTTGCISPAYCPALHTICFGIDEVGSIAISSHILDALASLVKARKPFGLMKLEIRGTLILDETGLTSKMKDRNSTLR